MFNSWIIYTRPKLYKKSGESSESGTLFNLDVPDSPRAIQFSNEDDIINRRGHRGTQRIDYSSAYLCDLCGEIPVRISREPLSRRELNDPETRQTKKSEEK